MIKFPELIKILLWPEETVLLARATNCVQGALSGNQILPGLAKKIKYQFCNKC